MSAPLSLREEIHQRIKRATCVEFKVSVTQLLGPEYEILIVETYYSSANYSSANRETTINPPVPVPRKHFTKNN